MEKGEGKEFLTMKWQTEKFTAKKNNSNKKGANRLSLLTFQSQLRTKTYTYMQSD